MLTLQTIEKFPSSGAVYGCLSVAESYSDRRVSWVPLYYHVKLTFLIWLQVPYNNNVSLL